MGLRHVLSVLGVEHGMRRRRGGLLLAVVAGLSVLVSGCGAGAPVSLSPGVVAEVGGVTLSRAALDHWIGVAEGSQSPSGGRVLFDPPRFSRCAEQLSARLPRGQVAGVQSVCERSYARLRQEAIRVLVSGAWVEQQARSWGIGVSAAVVRRRFWGLAGDGPGARRAFARSLARNGMSVSDALWRLRVEMLSGAIHSRVLASAGGVTAVQERSYYRAHRSAFARPESRDLRVVVVRSRAQGEQAVALLRGGASYSSVASRYGRDRVYGSPDGWLRGVVRGVRGPGFDGPVFGAVVGRWYGPIITPGGYYVFEVAAVHPAEPSSFRTAQSVIYYLLLAQRQSAAWTSFTATFERRWRSRTVCAPGFLTAQCGNAQAARGSAGRS